MGASARPLITQQGPAQIASYYDAEENRILAMDPASAPWVAKAQADILKRKPKKAREQLINKPPVAPADVAARFGAASAARDRAMAGAPGMGAVMAQRGTSY